MGIVESMRAGGKAIQISPAQYIDPLLPTNEGRDRGAGEFGVDVEGEIARRMMYATQGAPNDIDERAHTSGGNVGRKCGWREREFRQFGGHTKRLGLVHAFLLRVGVNPKQYRGGQGLITSAMGPGFDQLTNRLHGLAIENHDNTHASLLPPAFVDAAPVMMNPSLVAYLRL